MTVKSPRTKEKWCSWTLKKHRTEWCAAAGEYRCMRCGRSSGKMNIPG